MDVTGNFKGKPAICAMSIVHEPFAPSEGKIEDTFSILKKKS